MENPACENGYEEAKRKAKKFYGTLGRAWCPALGDFVVFNKSGFEHLVQKRGLQRPKSEQRRRFVLLPYIKDILQDKIVIATHEESKTLHITKIGGVRVAAVIMAQFWRMVAVRDGKIIKIVIRQIKGREKHFFSVFEGKQKSTR